MLDLEQARAEARLKRPISEVQQTAQLVLQQRQQRELLMNQVQI